MPASECDLRQHLPALGPGFLPVNERAGVSCILLPTSPLFFTICDVPGTSGIQQWQNTVPAITERMQGEGLTQTE